MMRLCAFVLSTALTAADPAAETLALHRQADRLRSDQAREEAAWALERQRLQAVIDGTRAETGRLAQAASAAAARRADLDRRIAGAGDAGDGPWIRARIADAERRWAAALEQLRGTLPPGTLPAVAGPDLDGVLAVLAAADQAATAVDVAVLTGRRDGAEVAVKVLRIAGAGAWWSALDGDGAGTMAADGTLTAVPAAGAAIRTAIAQVEGRAAAGIVRLPEMPR
jgi:hypothetical protein